MCLGVGTSSKSQGGVQKTPAGEGSKIQKALVRRGHTGPVPPSPQEPGTRVDLKHLLQARKLTESFPWLPRRRPAARNGKMNRRYRAPLPSSPTSIPHAHAGICGATPNQTKSCPGETIERIAHFCFGGMGLSSG